MKRIIHKCLQNSLEGDLLLDEFICELRKNPDKWFGFRENELEKFVELILNEVNLALDFFSEDQLISINNIKERIKNHFN